MTALTLRSPRLSVLTRIRRVWTQYRIKCAYDDLARYADSPFAGSQFMASTLAYIADLEKTLMTYPAREKCKPRIKLVDGAWYAYAPNNSPVAMALLASAISFVRHRNQWMNGKKQRGLLERARLGASL